MSFDAEDVGERFDSLAEAITAAIANHPESDCAMIAYVLLRMGGRTAGFNTMPVEAVLPIVLGSYQDGAAQRVPDLH